MPKPWGKYEIDYLDHPKFRALHANAIVLWHEAKNYCDKFHTDGRFPKEIVKTFRFSTAKAVEQLERSCGVKPNGDPYAPLWMAQDIGGVAYYVMHDYLDYNDCRDEVLARLADADERAALRRQKNKARQQRFREVRQETLRHADGNADRNAGGNAVGHTVCNALVTPVTRPPTVSVSVSVPERKKEDTHTPRGRERFGPTLMGNEHRAHAACGRACVPAFLHREFKRLLGGDDEQVADDRLRAWYARVLDQIPEDESIVSDAGKFWRPLFDAEFVTVKPSVAVNLQAHAEGIRDILRKQGAL